jgi:hypothetical protein
MQQVIIQSNAAERVQQVQQQHPDMQQRYFEAELGRERQAQQEKIGQSEENERLRLQAAKDREERRRKTGRRAKDSEDAAEEESDDADEKQFGRINIRV